MRSVGLRILGDDGVIASAAQDDSGMDDVFGRHRTKGSSTGERRFFAAGDYNAILSWHIWSPFKKNRRQNWLGSILKVLSIETESNALCCPPVRVTLTPEKIVR